MQFKDYYETLGVDRKASAAEIQRAYRKKARTYHPDINKDPGAEDQFKDIGEAYEVLKDDEKRSRYDRYGQAWQSAQSRGGGQSVPPGWEGIQFDFGDGTGGFAGTGSSGFSSFFDMLFGGNQGAGGQARGPAGPRRGQDQESNLQIALEELARGGKRKITLTDPMTQKQNTIEVTIPKGVRPGQRIRLAGRGAPGINGGAAGDLFLRISLLAHPSLEVDGNDLRTRINVPAWTAALGGEIRVPTLDGESTIKIPAGTSSGRQMRLRGKGLPGSGDTRGDLLAEIRLTVPDSLSDDQRRLFAELAATESAPPEPK